MTTMKTFNATSVEFLEDKNKKCQEMDIPILNVLTAYQDALKGSGKWQNEGCFTIDTTENLHLDQQCGISAKTLRVEMGACKSVKRRKFE